MSHDLVKDYYILFVGGILGEVLNTPFMGSYFKSNIRHIKKEYRHKYVGSYMPNSLNSSAKNARLLREKVLDLHKTYHRPVVLIGHSKGCQEMLLMALDSIYLIELGIIKKLITVQGSFEGSDLVDYLLGKVGKLKMTSFIQTQTHKFWPGLNDLKPNHAADTIQSKLNLLSDNQKDILKTCMHNIRGDENQNKDVSWIIKLSHLILDKKLAKDNDGLMPFSQQGVMDLDLEESFVKGDHSHHFTSWPIASSKLSHRMAFTDYLVNLAVD